jgi:hypothetical protein
LVGRVVEAGGSAPIPRALVTVYKLGAGGSCTESSGQLLKRGLSTATGSFALDFTATEALQLPPKAAVCVRAFKTAAGWAQVSSDVTDRAAEARAAERAATSRRALSSERSWRSCGPGPACAQRYLRCARIALCGCVPFSRGLSWRFEVQPGAPVSEPGLSDVQWTSVWPTVEDRDRLAWADLRSPLGGRYAKVAGATHIGA